MSGLCVQHVRRSAQLLDALRGCLRQERLLFQAAAAMTTTTTTKTPTTSTRNWTAITQLPFRSFSVTSVCYRWQGLHDHRPVQQRQLQSMTMPMSMFVCYSTAAGNGPGSAAGAAPKRTTDAGKNMTTSCEAFGAKQEDRYSASDNNQQTTATVDGKKPGIIAQFKDLYKRYWYVMVPVHVVTSSMWMGAFYYMSVSGVDVPELLRSIDISDNIVSRFEQSKMGHLAIAYLCYKIATPVRYAVTVGGTTVSIKYLSQWGYIKPLPSNERLLEIYADKKAQMKANYTEMQNKANDAMTGGTGTANKDDLEEQAKKKK